MMLSVSRCCVWRCVDCVRAETVAGKACACTVNIKSTTLRSMAAQKSQGHGHGPDIAEVAGLDPTMLIIGVVGRRAFT